VSEYTVYVPTERTQQQCTHLKSAATASYRGKWNVSPCAATCSANPKGEVETVQGATRRPGGGVGPGQQTPHARTAEAGVGSTGRAIDLAWEYLPTRAT
jgi:hypothetical protein